MSIDKDGQSMERLVDKIADKLGIATESLEPLAETLVSEFMWTNVVTAALSFILLAACLYLMRIVMGTFSYKMTKDASQGGMTILIFLGIGAAVCLFVMYNSLTKAVAPHYYLLKELLNS